MTDLSTRFLGLPLRNPLIVGSSSLADSPKKSRALAEAGAGAIIARSLFEQDVVPEAAGSFVDRVFVGLGADEYARLIEDMRRETDVPILASLHLRSPEAWAAAARAVTEAGAAAIELNLYSVVADERSGDVVERGYADLVDAVRAVTDLPLVAKLSPFSAGLPHLVAELGRHGARAVVLFGRPFEPDLDLDLGRPTRPLGLSEPGDSRLALRWIGLLNGRTPVELVGAGGVHDGQSALKLIAAGASAVQVCSALYLHSPSHLGVMVDEMRGWLGARGHETLEELRGTAHLGEALAQGQYLRGRAT